MKHYPHLLFDLRHISLSSNYTDIGSDTIYKQSVYNSLIVTLVFFFRYTVLLKDVEDNILVDIISFQFHSNTFKRQKNKSILIHAAGLMEPSYVLCVKT